MSKTSSATWPVQLRQTLAQNKSISFRSEPSGSLNGDEETIPPIGPGLKVPTILGNGALIKVAHDGGDINKLFKWFSARVRQSPADPALLLDLALLHLIQQRPAEAYELQARALERQQIFRVVGSRGEEVAGRRRVLALVAPGDFMNNAQLEFILDGSDIGLDVLYVMPGKPLPTAVPEHDVAFCAVNESDENAAVLHRLSGLLARWPRPVLNAPAGISQLSRDGVSSLFAGDEHLCIPRVTRVGRADLQKLASSEMSLDNLLRNVCFPVLVRPVGSHCGKNLEKIDGPADLASYLSDVEVDADQDDFFLAEFVDYRGSDGLFRKYRITLIDGVPYLCHMALSEQWKIHYVNVGMDESAAKRAEEAAVMQTFDQGFARRHRAAFASLQARLGLDYLGIDCAELPDGRLVIFEAETAMVIHRMDSPMLYPYKQEPMARAFAAFEAMIDRAAAGPAGSPQRQAHMLAAA
jgi:hypothetical protein